jgi:hypothetical protein
MGFQVYGFDLELSLSPPYLVDEDKVQGVLSAGFGAV